MKRAAIHCFVGLGALCWGLLFGWAIEGSAWGAEWHGHEPSFRGNMRFVDGALTSVWVAQWAGNTWCADGHCAEHYSNGAVALAMRNEVCGALGIGDLDTYNNLGSKGLSCYECGLDNWSGVDWKYFFCWPVASGVLELIPDEEPETDTYWLGVLVYSVLGCVLGLVFIRSVYSGAKL